MPLLLGAASELSKRHMIASMVQSNKLLDAVCSKPSCPAALVNGLDFDFLTEDFQDYNLRAALSASMDKICDKNRELYCKSTAAFSPQCTTNGILQHAMTTPKDS